MYLYIQFKYPVIFSKKRVQFHVLNTIVKDTRTLFIYVYIYSYLLLIVWCTPSPIVLMLASVVSVNLADSCGCAKYIEFYSSFRHV